MEELRGTFENSATENPLVSDSQKKPRIRIKKERKHCLWSDIMIN